MISLFFSPVYLHSQRQRGKDSDILHFLYFSLLCSMACRLNFDSEHDASIFILLYKSLPFLFRLISPVCMWSFSFFLFFSSLYFKIPFPKETQRLWNISIVNIKRKDPWCFWDLLKSLKQFMVIRDGNCTLSFCRENISRKHYQHTLSKFNVIAHLITEEKYETWQWIKDYKTIRFNEANIYIYICVYYYRPCCE